MDLERKVQTPEGRAYLSLPRIYDMELGRPTSSKDHPRTNNLFEPPLETEHNEEEQNEDELWAAAAEKAEDAYRARLVPERRKRIFDALVEEIDKYNIELPYLRWTNQ